MSARMCWTCNTEHDLDEACSRSATNRSAVTASGSLLFKRERVSRLGPVFTASYDCDDACCGDGIIAGDSIRADGQGGWIHANGECDVE